MTAKKTAKRILLALTLAAVAAISATALRGRSSDESTPGQGLQTSEFNDASEQQGQSRARRLEGSWAFTVTAVVPPGVPPPPVRNSYVSFARGGAAIGSDRQAPFANPQHGVWKHLRGNEFAYTFVGDNFDAMGNFQGTLKVRFKITLTGKDEFVGVDNAERRDPAGNLVFSRCNTIRGERIKIEPLPEQCQSITPPQ